VKKSKLSKLMEKIKARKEAKL